MGGIRSAVIQMKDADQSSSVKMVIQNYDTTQLTLLKIRSSHAFSRICFQEEITSPCTVSMIAVWHIENIDWKNVELAVDNCAQLAKKKG